MEQNEVRCPHCRSRFFLSREGSKRDPHYCSFCGRALLDTTLVLESDEESTQTQNTTSQPTLRTDATLVTEHAPNQNEVQFSLGNYQILRSIGKGGMGEVFLAYDPICGRRIALKRIRADLPQRTHLYLRFIKEARITSQLTHPSIIPIYAIHDSDNSIYYTMTYVEGENLKEIFKRTRIQEKKDLPLDLIGGSIPALARIFVSICQAVAYAHSKSVLHRDLKPENIIIGKYGEVMILDWGLAILLSSEESSETLKDSKRDTPEEENVTGFGKVVGTVAYMAPERGMGNAATRQTDIYSLGVILYQILTLNLPFRRENIATFRKTMHREVLPDPFEVAPYRDIPKLLVQICRKCLSNDLDERYKNVEDLIRDLESYIEGRSEWFLAAKLDINNKDDWEFQENVLIAEHIAITRGTEVSDWVMMMISKESFNETCKIEADVNLGEKCHGIGFLFGVPEVEERSNLNDGYSLWLGSDSQKGTKLLRSSIEVLTPSDIFLIRHQWYRIRIEKVDNRIHFFINDILQFSYISYLPISGTHVGLLTRDADYQLSNLSVFVGSQSVMVNCLAVPDAFLAHKDYTKALTEYRRIGHSFPGRAEGREAMFRAGITLLEQAKASFTSEERQKFYDTALQEFGKLHPTAGAPLEYLGKALVYEAQKDYEEEVKCYMLACRRYRHHPLLFVLKEQVLSRMYETSRYHRITAYNLILLVLRNMPDVAASSNAQKLFNSLQKHWEFLPFFEAVSIEENQESLRNLILAISIAFWLAKPYFLAEIIDELTNDLQLHPVILGNALFALIELGQGELAQLKMDACISQRPKEDLSKLEKIFNPLNFAIDYEYEPSNSKLEKFLSSIKKGPNFDEIRVLIHLMERALETQKTDTINTIYSRAKQWKLPDAQRTQIDCLYIWAALWTKDWATAEKVLHNYPIEQLRKENSLLHFLYGCWLHVAEGKTISRNHFSSVMEISYPRSWSLATHFINGKITLETLWFERAFNWEKKQLYRQLSLYYHCIGNEDLALDYLSLASG
jgi:serine/threonine-protein kinase